MPDRAVPTVLPGPARALSTVLLGPARAMPTPSPGPARAGYAVVDGADVNGALRAEGVLRGQGPRRVARALTTGGYGEGQLAA
ncbi:hypothetical protein ACWD4F_05865 [Streptomyces aureus]